MSRFQLFIKPTATITRLLLTEGDDEFLRAALPTPSQRPRAAPTLCEALALWLDRPLCVALHVDDQGSSYDLGLCDDLGLGRKTVHYDVELAFPRQRRGMGSFRDLRQLGLRGVR